MSTYFPTPEAATSARKWWLVDATGMTLGRLAAASARLLSGKHKPTWTPFIDTGDHVIVINSEKIVLTGNKLEGKIYRSHSGFPGGLKEVRARHLLEAHPERLVELAIKGMLPKNRIGRQMYRKLRVIVGSEHPHAAQNPEVTDLGLTRAAAE